MHDLPFTYLKLQAVCNATGHSKTKIYDLISRREFPEGDMISKQSRRWKSTEIAAWLEKTAAAAERNRTALQAPLRSRASLAAEAKRQKRSAAAGKEVSHVAS